MISLILPYWQRQEAADKAFETLKQYKDLDLEIIVVDDGNAIPFKIPEGELLEDGLREEGLNIRVVRLPEKSIPKSPVDPWNMGVLAAKGDIIALSCVEILHETPILVRMKEELEKLGEKGYIVASAWCPEENKWHVHPSVVDPSIPAGTGRSFLSMMYKAFYPRFDWEYREGAGYEDIDFIYRLQQNGAQFKIIEDHVVHPKTGAKIRWQAEALMRNKRLLEAKWSK